MTSLAAAHAAFRSATDVLASAVREEIPVRVVLVVGGDVTFSTKLPPSIVLRAKHARKVRDQYIAGIQALALADSEALPLAERHFAETVRLAQEYP